NAPAGLYPNGARQQIAVGSWELLEEGERIVLLAVGTMVEAALAVREALRASGLLVGVVNARFVKPVDRAMLAELVARYEALVTIEESTLAGGFGAGVY